MALLEQPTKPAQAPIDPEAARKALATGKWDDESALSLVVADATRAENYELQKSWVMHWPVAATIYQSPVTPRYWSDGATERANVPFFTVATAVNGLVPQIINGLFYENPPFMTQERPGTGAQAARAIGAILAYQLEDINFREELRLGAFNAVLFGTGIWKWGFETFTRERTIYRRKQPPVSISNPLGGVLGEDQAPDIQLVPDDEDIEEIVQEEYIDRPVFEHIVNLRHVLVDPGLNVPDIRKAKYVVHRLYLTWEDLDKLRERPGFKIPSREDLLELFLPPKEEADAAISEMTGKNPLWDARAEERFRETTDNPFQEPLEVLERWDNDSYIVVLQKKLVICNDANPYGVIPYLSVGWWDVPEAFWSLGLARTIGAEQRLQQGITNIWLDQASLVLNGVYVRVRGKSVPTQNILITPGRIIEVDNKDDFQPLARTPAVPEAGQHLSLSQARVEQVSGANELTTQGLAGQTAHSNLGRTAAGANLIGNGAGNRPADFVEKLSNQVIVPFLYQAHELNRAMLPISTIKYILGEELQHEYIKGGGDPVDLLNAKLRFTILAGAKMQARRNMAQALPILVQYLTNQQTESQLAIQGLKVDVAEVLRMFWQVSDWQNFKDVVIPMTPEDKKRWEMMQAGAQQNQKFAHQKELQQQQFDNKSQLVDNENMARAGREVLRQAIEQSASPEALRGAEGGQGFGVNA